MHTRRRNPAGEVGWKVKCVINPEFLTQAWTKFYECACTYNIIPNQVLVDKKMVSLHLCEAPGAFIASLNHFLQSNFQGIEWHWAASTLNPYYEGNSLANMISDDRFMFHTLDHWVFGADNTGNLMNWDNSQAIIQQAKSLGKSNNFGVKNEPRSGQPVMNKINAILEKVEQDRHITSYHIAEELGIDHKIILIHSLKAGCTKKLDTWVPHKVMLVTADGSIDCLERPDAQEEITSPLHYCEIVTGLQALSEGNLFNEVHIYKPATSRQGNSEVYAVCLGFHGYDHLKSYIPILKTAYGTELYSNKAIFPKECIPEDFLQQVVNCANYFCEKQCEVINRNLAAYFHTADKYSINKIKRLRLMVSSEFIVRCVILRNKHVPSSPNFNCVKYKTMSVLEFDYSEPYDVYEKRYFVKLYNHLTEMEEGRLVKYHIHTEDGCEVVAYAVVFYPASELRWSTSSINPTSLHAYLIPSQKAVN
ncbi:Cap-specific mRNA [Eumeta japonica]|uniref:Cap-specific mRNA (nucleoside-2'-O-)-methyltransferase 2 n=1 Tax=Eumeta variegata TaxID=151549 RepID=A0A4C1TTH3_EUMVA|nr:Cap-specific mRNA [Eumeta japonica]